MDNAFNNTMFTEPTNKSDQTGLKQQENFPQETNERYSINERLRKERSSFSITPRLSLTFLE